MVVLVLTGRDQVIINIAGTSGSGKTHLIREFLSWVGEATCKPQYIAGRKPPIGYTFGIEGVLFFLMGAYEDADTAGCDTIRDVVQIFDLIREKAKRYHVIYEGLIVMNHTRGPQLAAEYGKEFVILQLDVPYATCVASINSRRSARGQGRLLDKKNTKGNFVRAANYCTKMQAQGARVIKVRRDAALEKLLELVEGAVDANLSSRN